MPKSRLRPASNQYLNLLIDTTFGWSRSWCNGLLRFIIMTGCLSPNCTTEKDSYYKVAMSKLREKGYIIQSITCNGIGDLLKDLFNPPHSNVSISYGRNRDEKVEENALIGGWKSAKSISKKVITTAFISYYITGI